MDFLNNYIDNYNYQYSEYNYYQQLILDLAEYIQDELQDSYYYHHLAKKAPTERAKTIILEFSKDEKQHANNFQRAYMMLTGSYFNPSQLKPVTIDDYTESLKIRILAETDDYKKYGEQYLKAPTRYLQDLFYMTRTVEAQHAMRIPILFEEEDE